MAMPPRGACSVKAAVRRKSRGCTRHAQPRRHAVVASHRPTENHPHRAAPEDILFSDTVVKINRKDKAQERVLVITDRSVYNLTTGRKVKRRIDIKRVEGVTVSQISDEFVIHVPDEYDYRMSGPRKAEAIECIVTSHLTATGVTISVHLSAALQLKDVTVTRVDSAAVGAAGKKPGAPAAAAAGGSAGAAAAAPGGGGGAAAGAVAGTGAAAAAAAAAAAPTPAVDKTLMSIAEGDEEDDAGKELTPVQWQQVAVLRVVLRVHALRDAVAAGDLRAIQRVCSRVYGARSAGVVARMAAASSTMPASSSPPIPPHLPHPVVAPPSSAAATVLAAASAAPWSRAIDPAQPTPPPPPSSSHTPATTQARDPISWARAIARRASTGGGASGGASSGGGGGIGIASMAALLLGRRESSAGGSGSGSGGGGGGYFRAAVRASSTDSGGSAEVVESDAMREAKQLLRRHSVGGSLGRTDDVAGSTGRLASAGSSMIHALTGAVSATATSHGTSGLRPGAGGRPATAFGSGPATGRRTTAAGVVSPDRPARASAPAVRRTPGGGVAGGVGGGGVGGGSGGGGGGGGGGAGDGDGGHHHATGAHDGAAAPGGSAGGGGGAVRKGSDVAYSTNPMMGGYVSARATTRKSGGGGGGGGGKGKGGGGGDGGGARGPSPRARRKSSKTASPVASSPAPAPPSHAVDPTPATPPSPAAVAPASEAVVVVAVVDGAAAGGEEAACTSVPSSTSSSSASETAAPGTRTGRRRSRSVPRPGRRSSSSSSSASSASRARRSRSRTGRHRVASGAGCAPTASPLEPVTDVDESACGGTTSRPASPTATTARDPVSSAGSGSSVWLGASPAAAAALTGVAADTAGAVSMRVVTAASGGAGSHGGSSSGGGGDGVGDGGDDDDDDDDARRPPPVTLESFELLRVLGKGSYGKARGEWGQRLACSVWHPVVLCRIVWRGRDCELLAARHYHHCPPTSRCRSSKCVSGTAGRCWR